MSEPHPPPLPKSETRAKTISRAIAILLPLIYGGLFRWAFATDFFRNAGGVVSLSFILSVPIGFGFLSVAIGRWRGSDNFKDYGIYYPFLSLSLGLLICLLFKFEAIICVIMAAPILFGAVFSGALLANVLLPKNSKNTKLYVSLAALLPLLSGHVEEAFAWPTEIVAIHNSIDIKSTPEIIWQKIASVEKIPATQISNRWIYWVGFPKPISAVLDHEGVGGVRTATFERNVSFFETIQEWDYARKLAFSIHADPEFIPHTAFDKHIIVGGRFYDVLDGIYEIEKISDNMYRLHLTSHHRLGTRFNSYAQWWSENIMNQIQSSILEVVQRRAEGRL